MYEPYPYHIDKTKVVFLILLSIILFGGLLFLIYGNINFSVSTETQLITASIGYVLLFLLMTLCIKSYLLKYSRDYLYIGTAAFLMLCIGLFQHAVSAYVNISPAACDELRLEKIIFGILMLLTAYNAGKSITVKWKILYFIITPVISLVVAIAIGWILLLYIFPQYEIYPSVIIFSLLVLLWAEIIFIRLYDAKSYNIYFWFVNAVLFFIFSDIYLLVSDSPTDKFGIISTINSLSGLLFLIIVTYEEHTRFMESEINIRKSLEKSLLQVEQNLESYQNLVNQVDVGIFVIDEEGLVTFSNQSLGEMFGIPKEQLIGQNQNSLFDEANLDKLLIEREKWTAGLKSQFEIELLNRRGKNIPVMISATPIRDKLGRFRGSRNVVIRIEAWKEFERKIKEYSDDLEKKIQERTQDLNQKSDEWKRAKTYYETLISGMLDILLVVDQQGNCIFINDYGKKLLGYEAEELNKKRLPNFFADMKNLQKNYGDSMKIELRDYEAELKSKIGQKILCSWNVRYLFDHDGKNIGAMCVGRDITEHKILQQKLEEHSKNLEKLVSQRTEELNLKVQQLAKILQIGEDIILNIKLPEILSNICNVIQGMGWNIVIIALRQEDVPFSKIASITGIPKNRVRRFITQKDYLFKNTLKFLKDEYRIGHSYYLEHATLTDSNFITHGIERKGGVNQSWREGDVLLCPIKIKNRILGFIMVFDPVNGLQPNKEELQLLEIFAQKAAVAIENNNLFKQVQTRAQESENVNKIRSEFFANMSHELRTPLNSIITLTGILTQKMTGELNTEQMRQINIIKRNGERLLKLINNILDLSKIEAGRMDVNYTYFPINEVIQANMDTIRPLAYTKRLKLDLKVDKDVPQYIFSDKDKIDQVLTNLISNSVKFTNQGKVLITIAAKDKGKLLEISIKDTGVGIDKNDLEYIFEPFRQSENVDGMHKKGTGLGLSISRQLMRMLGGDITVDSKRGRGTEFLIRLPLKEVESDKIAATQTEDEKSQASEDMEIKKVPRRIAEKNKHILLVDDNLDNQYAVKFILEDKGYQVSFARNGAEGVKKAIKEKPDLILMDMMMPGMDGYQATRNIRKRNEFKSLPIIAMTAKTEAEDEGQALDAGCSDYLSKPFSLEDIISKIQKWIEEKR